MFSKIVFDLVSKKSVVECKKSVLVCGKSVLVCKKSVVSSSSNSTGV